MNSEKYQFKSMLLEKLQQCECFSPPQSHKCYNLSSVMSFIWVTVSCNTNHTSIPYSITGLVMIFSLALEAKYKQMFVLGWSPHSNPFLCICYMQTDLKPESQSREHKIDKFFPKNGRILTCQFCFYILEHEISLDQNQFIFLCSSKLIIYFCLSMKLEVLKVTEPEY